MRIAGIRKHRKPRIGKELHLPFAPVTGDITGDQHSINIIAPGIFKHLAHVFCSFGILDMRIGTKRKLQEWRLTDAAASCHRTRRPHKSPA